MNLTQINLLWEEYKAKYDIDSDAKITAVRYDTDKYVEGCFNLLELLEKRAGELGFCNVRRAMCGCVISCHGGPGALGIAGFAQEGH